VKKLLLTNSIILLFCTVILPCKGQNLVFNGDLSIVDTCRITSGGIAIAPDFYSPNSTSTDLYHTCSVTPFSFVPNNIMLGIIHPPKGEGFFGFGAWFSYPYFEYIGTPLSEPLKPGYTYCINFAIRKAKLYGSGLSFDRLGVLLSNEKITSNSLDYLKNIPQLETPKGEIILNDTHWEIINFEYTASGGEKFMTIGQFYPPDSLMIDTLDPTADMGAYYFIGDIQVIECAPPKAPLVTLPNVFSPNDDGINDLYSAEIAGAREVDLQIHNRWGNTVFATNDPNFEWDGTYNGKPLPAGVYFVVVHAKGFGGEQTTKTQTLHLLR
jgi:gliding motility-associated-like protein